MTNQKIAGLVMVITGFIMLVINAIGYVFNLETRHPALTTLGLIFVAIGMARIKKSM